MKVQIFITLKEGVLDPQGKASEQALQHLGFEGVSSVRQGKLIELEIEGDDKLQVGEQVEAMCKTLLANTVIENYHYEIA